MFGRMRTGTKILAAFGVVLSLVAVLAAVSHSSTDKLGDIVENYSRRKLPGTSALWSIRQAETAARANTGIVVNPLIKGELRDDARKRIAASLDRIAKAEKDYAALPHGRKTTALWGEYRPLADRWQREMAALRAAIEERDRAADASEARRAELDRRAVQADLRLTTASMPLQEVTNALIAQTAEDAAALRSEAEHVEHDVNVALLAAVTAIALILLGLGWLLSRSIGGVIRGLLSEAGKLTAAVQAGKLDVRADPAAVTLEFRPVLEGVNATIGAFVRPIEVTAGYVDRISRGDVPPRITDEYAGDFNAIKNNLNR